MDWSVQPTRWLVGWCGLRGNASMLIGRGTLYGNEALPRGAVCNGEHAVRYSKVRLALPQQQIVVKDGQWPAQ
jgi:hypothetical protein